MASGTALPPPRTEVGAIGWVYANLFNSPHNAALTVVIGVVAGFALWFGLKWVILDADWSVISTIGGRFVIGNYNTDQSCPGNNCFWRPQVSLLMVTTLLGMGWAIVGGNTARNLALVVTAVLCLFAFLPYSMDRMGWDVRLLLLANLPTLALGWALARYTALGTVRWLMALTVVAFLLTLALLRGVPEIPARQTETVVLVGLLFVTLLLGAMWGMLPQGGVEGASRGSLQAREQDMLSRRNSLFLGVVLSVVVEAILAALVYATGWWSPNQALALSIVPGLYVGWAVGRYTGITAPGIVICATVFILIVLALQQGVPQAPGLQPVAVSQWGGLMLNLMLAAAGIGISLPIGIALALGRRSRLPVVKLLCVVFIEVFRGVPLITLLFMSQVLVPLAFPDDFPLDSLFRAAVVITLFSSAYMAENIRGGLQSLHPGQAEAARALGLPIWQTTLFISLPQAIRNVIPAIVGQFIGLFKDTSLIYIISMLDVVEIGRTFISGNTEYLANAKELFIFLALVFWVFTYTMSYVSQKVEEHLGVGRR